MTRHSMLARHSLISGASTAFPGSGVTRTTGPGSPLTPGPESAPVMGQVAALRRTPHFGPRHLNPSGAGTSSLKTTTSPFALTVTLKEFS